MVSRLKLAVEVAQSLFQLHVLSKPTYSARVHLESLVG